jgi:DNA-binding winged helix-turn-helix (wHTH) protein
VAKPVARRHERSVTSTPCFTFGPFTLDAAERRLTRDGDEVELNARYFDALALLVREAGKLVSKDRFMDEVWRGIPVTDEALTQCIRTLRRQLGDAAGDPRFIETVPKHGYRFIAPVRGGDEDTPAAAASMVEPRPPEAIQPWRRVLLLGASGTAGAGVAGLIGGVAYGLIGASQALQPGVGAISMLLVLMLATLAIAFIGGAAVAYGIAAAGTQPNRLEAWSIVGGAIGGLLVGAVVKLLGLDAFNLLVGHSPAGITGAAEGAVLGAGAGLGAWLASRMSVRRGAVCAGLIGGAAGLLIALGGGRLLGGSLASLAGAFPQSRLRLDQLGRWFGEEGFGPVTNIVTAGLEGMLFTAGLVAAMMIGLRRMRPPA